MAIQEQRAQADGRSSSKRWTWPGLLRAAIAGELILAGFWIAIGSADVGIPVAVLLVPGLLWLRRQSRGAAIYASVASTFTGLVVLVAFGNLSALAFPTSWEMFISAASLLVFTVVAILAGVGSVRRRASETAAARRLARFGAAAIAGFVVFGVGAGLTVKSDSRRPGDLLLTITPSVESSPRELTAEPGRISLLVRNESIHRNTLTIEGVVDREVPARSAKRVTFSAPPGTYRFYSDNAPDDTAGTLVVR